MDEEALKAEKMRLENILKELCRQTESEQQNEIINLLKEYNSVKDAVQVRFFSNIFSVELEILLLWCYCYRF